MDINDILKEAEKMQTNSKKVMTELLNSKFDYNYKNGAIVVTMSGSGLLVSIKINKELIDPEDPTTLQEMIVEAVNVAIKDNVMKKLEVQKQMIPNFSKEIANLTKNLDKK